MSSTSNQLISVTRPDFNTDRNVILWLDHRAIQEVVSINKTKHNVLQYVGGVMLVEMEMPKILWMKKNMPADNFKDCKFYDLADVLAHMATGTESHNLFCHEALGRPGSVQCLRFPQRTTPLAGPEEPGG